jgi:antitoxin component YwqK of YwqJK toxin-antitoxin module
MKKIGLAFLSLILASITVGSLTASSQSLKDPYAGYDPDNQLRPPVNTADFYRLEGDELCWLMLDPINIAKDYDEEPELAKRFSPGQKALYFWWFMDAQVTNGGIYQFYFNDYIRYMPAIITGLEHIGDEQMHKLALKAHNIYLKNKKQIDKALKKGWDYDNGDDWQLAWDDLSSEYYEINEASYKHFAAYIRSHPEEFCVRENGEPFEKNYTGEIRAYYDSGELKEIFYLKDGKLDHILSSYYKNGTKKEMCMYVKGIRSGFQKEWREDGSLKKVVINDPEGAEITTERYHENGKKAKVETRDASDRKIGPYKEWYANGQLKKEGTYNDQNNREGTWLEFWEAGAKKLEASYENGKFRPENYWNEAGDQLLKKGTGLYVSTYEDYFGKVTVYETEYVDYQRHGKSSTTEEGILQHTMEYKNDVQHGISRTYYDNGALEKESIYVNGVKKSTQEFDKFQRAAVATQVICEMTDEWLTNRELQTADRYPEALNAEELAENFKVGIDFFAGYPQDYELRYMHFVEVDESGKVSKVDFLVASNARILKEVESNIKKLKFKPAMKDGKAVASYVIIRHLFKLAEGE